MKIAIILLIAAGLIGLVGTIFAVIDVLRRFVKDEVPEVSARWGAQLGFVPDESSVQAVLSQLSHGLATEAPLRDVSDPCIGDYDGHPAIVCGRADGLIIAVQRDVASDVVVEIHPQEPLPEEVAMETGKATDLQVYASDVDAMIRATDERLVELLNDHPQELAMAWAEGYWSVALLPMGDDTVDGAPRADIINDKELPAVLSWLSHLNDALRVLPPRAGEEEHTTAIPVGPSRPQADRMGENDVPADADMIVPEYAPEYADDIISAGSHDPLPTDPSLISSPVREPELSTPAVVSPPPLAYDRLYGNADRNLRNDVVDDHTVDSEDLAAAAAAEGFDPADDGLHDNSVIAFPTQGFRSDEPAAISTEEDIFTREESIEDPTLADDWNEGWDLTPTSQEPVVVEKDHVDEESFLDSAWAVDDRTTDDQSDNREDVPKEADDARDDEDAVAETDEDTAEDEYAAAEQAAAEEAKANDSADAEQQAADEALATYTDAEALDVVEEFPGPTVVEDSPQPDEWIEASHEDDTTAGSAENSEETEESAEPEEAPAADETEYAEDRPQDETQVESDTAAAEAAEDSSDHEEAESAEAEEPLVSTIAAEEILPQDADTSDVEPADEGADTVDTADDDNDDDLVSPHEPSFAFVKPPASVEETGPLPVINPQTTYYPDQDEQETQVIVRTDTTSEAAAENTATTTAEQAAEENAAAQNGQDEDRSDGRHGRHAEGQQQTPSWFVPGKTSRRSRTRHSSDDEDD